MSKGKVALKPNLEPDIKLKIKSKLWLIPYFFFNNNILLGYIS